MSEAKKKKKKKQKKKTKQQKIGQYITLLVNNKSLKIPQWYDLQPQIEGQTLQWRNDTEQKDKQWSSKLNL